MKSLVRLYRVIESNIHTSEFGQALWFVLLLFTGGGWKPRKKNAAIFIISINGQLTSRRECWEGGSTTRNVTRPPFSFFFYSKETTPKTDSPNFGVFFSFPFSFRRIDGNILQTFKRANIAKGFISLFSPSAAIFPQRNQPPRWFKSSRYLVSRMSGWLDRHHLGWSVILGHDAGQQVAQVTRVKPHHLSLNISNKKKKPNITKKRKWMTGMFVRLTRFLSINKILTKKPVASLTCRQSIVKNHREMISWCKPKKSSSTEY